MSLPDPDVLTVEIQVQVKALAGDALAYPPLYRTTRTFDADEMTIELDIQDHPTLDTLAENQPVAGPLVLPSARDLRLTFTGIGRDDPGTSRAPKLAKGHRSIEMFARMPLKNRSCWWNRGLFPALRSFFFQPPPPDNSVSSPIERLGAEITLDRSALTLSGPTGRRRTVIACSSELRHTLSPEASAITFASAADLVQRWINVVQFTLQRDWTWDGLDPAGIAVTRTVRFPDADLTERVGNITFPRSLAKKSAADIPDARAACRQSTQVIFFDAFDPKPKAPRKFPSEITIEYTLQPIFGGPPPPDPVSRSILLP